MGRPRTLPGRLVGPVLGWFPCLLIRMGHRQKRLNRQCTFQHRTIEGQSCISGHTLRHHSQDDELKSDFGKLRCCRGLPTYLSDSTLGTGTLNLTQWNTLLQSDLPGSWRSKELGLISLVAWCLLSFGTSVSGTVLAFIRWCTQRWGGGR